MNRYHRNEPEPWPPGYHSPLLSGSGLELMMILRERTAEIRNEQQRQTEIALATMGKVDSLTLLVEKAKPEKTHEGWLGALLRVLGALKDLGETVANIKELLVMVLLALLALRIIVVPDPIRSLIFGQEKPAVVGAVSHGSP